MIISEACCMHYIHTDMIKIAFKRSFRGFIFKFHLTWVKMELQDETTYTGEVLSEDYDTVSAAVRKTGPMHETWL